MSEDLADVRAAIETARAEVAAKQPVVQPVIEAAVVEQTTPVTTEPPKADAPKSNVTEPVVNQDADRLKSINEIWGTDFKSIDEFKQVKSEYDQLPSLKEYKTKFEEISSKPLPAFANDRIKEENNFIIATGLEDASVLKDIRRFEASTEKDPIEALVIQAILKNPKLADNKAVLRKSIARDFKIDIKQTDDNGEPLSHEALAEEKERVEIEQLKLNMRAMDAEKDIKETMDKFKGYVPQEQTQSKQSETKAQWEGQLSNIGLDVFKTIPVQVSLGKDKEGKEQFETIDTIELTQDEQKGCFDRAVNFALANNLDLTQDNLVLAVSHQIHMVQAANLSRIVSKVRETESSKVRKEIEISIHNPSPTPNIPIPETGDDGKMTADKLLQLQMKHMGG